MIYGQAPGLLLARGAVGRPAQEWRPADISTTFAAPKRPKWRVPAVLAAVVGLGATAFVASNGADGSSFEPIAEPAVAAEDLPLGAMYHVVDQIGARGLWAQGVTGAGVNVAVIDTGVAPVDGLADEGKIVAVVDLSPDAGDPSAAFVDGHGHGTHLAGIIAGRETAADPALAAEHPEWFLGVAPDAGIVSVKVSDSAGEVQPASVISGVDWVIANAEELGIGVLNLSFSSGSDLPYQQDALTAALERAWQAGIVVVTPAGNSGPDSAGLDSPAIDPYVVAVAAADVSADGIAVADFASSGDGERGPDVAAPGAHIDSLRAPGSLADVEHPEGFVDDETFRGSGASQAAAVVSGAAALLLDARPELTPDQVKALLRSTADEIVGTPAERAGSGLINLERAAVADVGEAVQTWTPAESDTAVPAIAGVSMVWSGATWVGATWVGATWVGATWVGATWVGATWVGATWVGATWVGATWVGATWVGATWVGATWVGATWVGATWVGATWVGATWVGATWVGATWV